MTTRTKITIIGGLLALELLSFLAYFFPVIGPIVIMLAGAGIFYLAWKRPEAALLVLLTELVIGSKGHLFSWNGEDSFSLRMVIFLAVMLAFAIKTIVRWPTEGRSLIGKLRALPFIKPYLLLGLAVLIGLIVGFFRNDFANLAADANAWLYFAILLPFVAVYFRSTPEARQRLMETLELAAVWLGIKTLIFLYLFSHKVVFLSDLYWWIRQSGVGEVTAMSGGWMRIFIQSQIFSVLMLTISIYSLVSQPLPRFRLWLSRYWKPALYLSTIILSMSRSFWLALAALGIGAGIWLLFSKRWRELGRLALAATVSLMLAAAAIFVIIRFPYPATGGAFSVKAFSERADLGEGEAAVSSRWNLLPPLAQAAFESPILGQGFGRTVTYRTEDPRLVLSGRQDYTTYAFEWGYLDILLKTGVIGLFAYLWLLFSIVRAGWKKKNSLGGGLVLGVILLAAIHIFTPYLNHPLGIAYIVLASCLIPDDTV